MDPPTTHRECVLLESIDCIPSSLSLNVAFLGPTELCGKLAEYLVAASDASELSERNYNLLEIALHGSMVGSLHYDTDPTRRNGGTTNVAAQPPAARKTPINLERQQHSPLRIQIAESILDLPTTAPAHQPTHHYVLVLESQNISIQAFLLDQLSLIPPEYIPLQRVSLLLLTNTSVHEVLSDIRNAFQRKYTSTSTTSLLQYLPLYIVSCNLRRNVSPSSDAIIIKTMRELLHRMKLGCRHLTNSGVSPMFFSCIN
jgi:hypothetical protein